MQAKISEEVPSALKEEDLQIRREMQHLSAASQTELTSVRETTYCGPKTRIPDFTKDDRCQFARLKLALENLLPAHATERFKFQILVDHLKLEDAQQVSLHQHNGIPHKTVWSATQAGPASASLKSLPSLQSRVVAAEVSTCSR